MSLVYKEIINNNINELVDAHKKVFQEYFITNLGDRIIRSYYENFLSDKGTVAIGVFDQNNLVGFAIFTDNYDEIMNSYLHKNKIQLTKTILLRILCLNKVVVKNILSKVKKLFLKKNNNYEEDSNVLLSIGVRKEYRNKSIAKELMILGENDIFSRNINVIGLSVKKDNIGAIRFYEKMGYCISFESEDLYYMRKKRC